MLAVTWTRADDPSILARVGDVEIKVADIRASLKNLSSSDEAALAGDPALLNQMVRSLAVQRLLLKQALEQGFDKKPEIAAQLDRARDSTLAEAWLQSASEPPQDFPSEAEVRAVYDANKTALVLPRSYRMAQIFIVAPKDAKTSAKLESVTAKLKKRGADFAAIARTDSEEPQSASRGGEIGWLTEAQIQPEIRAQIPSLKLGSVSEAIRLADGWHILKTLDVREPFTPTFDQARPALTKRMREDRAKQNTQAYLAQLLGEQPLAVNELALSKVLPGAAK